MWARNVWVRLTVAVACSTAAAGPARADKMTDELTATYEKEAAACSIQAGGVGKVANGAARLADSLSGAEREALDADLGKLDKGRAAVDVYCAELAAALEILHANPGAKYRAIERQLDEHDNKIRRARTASKKAISDLEPVIHALVPRINALVAPAQPEVDKRAPSKFPSGRGVVLPVLPGTWRVSGTPTSDTADYAEAAGVAGKGSPAIAASVWTRPFDGATCEQEKRSPTGATADDQVSDAAKNLGIAWIAHGVVRDGAGGPRSVAYACLPTAAPAGGWMGYVTVQPSEPEAAVGKARAAMEELMVRMLAAQKTPTGTPTPTP